MCSLEDGVCVQVHTAHVWRGVIKIKVARVHSNNKWTGSAQNVSQRQGTQGNIRARPMEWEDHLRGGMKMKGLLVLFQIGKHSNSIYDINETGKDNFTT